MNMIPLLDSAIGFIAILLTLSLLVKSLTSLIKSYVDYYSEHLRAEVDQFLQGMLNQSLQTLVTRAPWVGGINWKSLGEEYFTRDKMVVLLRQLDPNWVNLGDLDARIDLHLANLKYTFERRMKNLALATGVGLCLFLNVNALTIWKTLYKDQQLRTTFATTYADKALTLANDEAKSVAQGAQGVTPQLPASSSPGSTAGSATAPPAAAGADAKKAADDKKKSDPANPVTAPPSAEEKKKELKAQSEVFRDNTEKFLADVNFGVGRLWKEEPNVKPSVFFYELLGSLVTGILVSIGAPYWHDLLRTLAGLRKPSR